MLQRTHQEKDVLSVINTLQNMINPFESNSELINLSSGLVAIPDVKNVSQIS